VADVGFLGNLDDEIEKMMGCPIAVVWGDAEFS
jgi:hypothetical protein